jgi:(p)ppGpp synthase/HD superfamily hydrolase
MDGAKQRRIVSTEPRLGNNSPYNSVVENSGTRLVSAVSLAAHLHRDQKRKGTEIPYLSHLLAVSSLVMEARGSEDEVIAALLHDAIEDQGDSYEGGRSGLRNRIGSDFGPVVLGIVNACTDDEGHLKGEAASEQAEAIAWRNRKRQYITHLGKVEDLGILRVSCADKLHNVRCMVTDYQKLGDAIWQRFRTKSRDDQLWYYRELSQVFSGKNVGDIADQLRWVVKLLDSISCDPPAQEAYDTDGAT